MSDRLPYVLDRFAVHRSDPRRTLGDALCATCTDVLAVSGAGLTLRDPSGRAYGVGSSNAVMAHLEDLERTLGEGPCVDAFEQGIPVAEPDLEHPIRVRWVAFGAAALRTEARAAFGYPLRVGGSPIGALNLYAETPGALTVAQHEDAVLLADLSTNVLLASALDTPDIRAGELLDVGTNQLVVHQATGMIAVQVSTSITGAHALLRARAFAEERPVSAVAADVVERRLRFAP